MDIDKNQLESTFRELYQLNYEKGTFQEFKDFVHQTFDGWLPNHVSVLLDLCESEDEFVTKVLRSYNKRI